MIINNLKRPLSIAGYFFTPGFSSLIFAIIYLTYTLIFIHSNPVNLKVILQIIYGIISLNVFIQLIIIITSQNRRLRMIGIISILFIILTLSGYRHTSNIQFDFAVAVDNIQEAGNSEAADIITASIGRSNVIILLVLFFIFVFLELKTKVFSKVTPKPPYIQKLIILLIFYFVIIIFPFSTYDPIAGFFKSVYFYYAYERNLPAIHEIKDNRYPLVKNFYRGENPSQKNYNAFEAKPANKNLPDIFLIILESYNSQFIGKMSGDRKEITPVFNKLIPRGLYVEKFYANSIQTCKGHAAIFLSLIPAIHGKIYRRFSEVNYRSLPEILMSKGYKTVFFQGYYDLSMDNTERFLQKNGFLQIKTVYDSLNAEEKNEIRSFGPEDTVVFKKFFNFIDKNNSDKSNNISNSSDGRHPLFAVIATINHHMNFDSVPADKRYIYKDPGNFYENYVNSLHLSDMGLAVFINELEKRKQFDNSIIVITGDHSYPVGNHGIVRNEAGFYHESFTTPFLVIWKGKINPERIRDKTFSQIDIAPTILDLLNLSATEENHFIGRSIFSKSDKDIPVYLVQPYSGIYLSVIRYPYRYIKHEQTGDEFLFNLDQDARENYNLINIFNTDKLDNFRRDILYFYFQQRLLIGNRIFPR
jgi:phosphoglycerol transferase MdoB-like AlkP superfamily enzyme